MKSGNINAWLAFAAVGFFWGTTFLAIRIGVESFPPFLMAGFRHSIGGILICTYFLVRRYQMPEWKDLKVLAINGILMLVIGNGLVTWAEIYVSSGLAALICSLTPIWIVLLNTLSGHKENLTWKVLVGLLICMFGQLLIFRDNLTDFANPNYTLGIIAILFANMAWGFGTVYIKSHKTSVHPLFGAGLQMICGGAILDLFGTFRGEWSQMHPNAHSVWALVYLILIGSVVAYGAYNYALQHLPATILSTYAYINTIVAVFLGWLMANEKMNLITVIAVTLTIGGVYLINRTFQKS